MKSSIIKDDKVNRIYIFLSRAYEQTKGGYTRLSLSDIARAADISGTAHILKAVRSLGMMKLNGSAAASLWYWSTVKPDRDMADKVYSEAIRIKLNEKIQKDEKERISGLVPIINKSKTKASKTKANALRNTVERALLDMYNNSDDLINIGAASKRYGLAEDPVFGTLIALDIIKPHERIPNQYKWAHGAPDAHLIDLIMDAYKSIDKVSIVARKTRRLDRQPIINKLLAALNEIFDDSPYTNSAVTLFKKHGLASHYLTYAIKSGYLKNSGGTTNPSYTIDKPTNKMASVIDDAVCDYWKLKSRDRKDDKKVKGTKSTPYILAAENLPAPKHIEKSIVSQPTDLNAIFARAEKRRVYLEAELAKVNKIIDAISTVQSLSSSLDD